MSFKYTVVSPTLKFLGYDLLDQPGEILRAVKDAGYDGVDLFDEPERRNAKELRQIVDSLGLKIPEVMGSWGGENRDLAGPDEKVREKGIEYAKKAIDFTVEVGAQFFGYCLPQPFVPQVPFTKLPVKTLKKNLLRALKKVCAYAADRDITVVIEPLNCYESYPGVLTTVYETMSIIKDLGFSNIGIQPDIFHMNISEASISDAIRAAGRHVKHVHMNETNHCRHGTGHADYKAIMKTLKEIKFRGYIAIYMPLTTREIFMGGGNNSDRPDLKPYLEKPLKYLKEIVELERKSYEIN